MVSTRHKIIPVSILATSDNERIQIWNNVKV